MRLIFCMVALLLATGAANAESTTPVTVDTFVRAETDTAIREQYDRIGMGTFQHIREPAPLDNQFIIRMNRDTIYSGAVVDLSEPVTVTLPDAQGRYMSVHIISQDHYMFVVTEPGDIELTRERVGTRYAFIAVRTFVGSGTPEDIAAANTLQDQLKITGGGDGPLDLPDWDQKTLLIARGALNELATLGFSTARAFGTKEDTDPVDYLIGAAAGWGGLPQASAFYQIDSVPDNDGSPQSLTVKDVPVDAFWSVTVYNADGFIDQNDLGVYSYNSVSAKPNEDGSVTINFGGCDDGRINCLPISEGWNYANRMYQPRQEILDGDWVFPSPKQVQ